ncbi:MAG: hypothetical protein CEN90_554 [Parcubacteria group bacterium Licking1014_17]|nr:MAG: hypothetical protein CEN90_554 [Parcubacteria group bacterium Licking1014_17]
MKVGEQVRLARLDVVPRDSVVFAGPAKEVMTLVPFSRYDNDALGTDESDEEKVYLLSKTGQVITEVRGGYSSRHSDGSYSSGEGEQVKATLKNLRKAERGRVQFVLVVKKQKAEDNTVVTSRSENHEFRGLKTRNDVAAKLYAIQ